MSGERYGGHVDGEHALVPCPVCGSTARRCSRPGGHDPGQWHLERDDALALLRRGTCPRCAEWAAKRKLVAIAEAQGGRS